MYYIIIIIVMNFQSMLAFVLCRYLALTTFYFLLETRFLLCSADCKLHQGSTPHEKSLLELISPLKNTVLDINVTPSSNAKTIRYIVAICTAADPKVKADAGALQFIDNASYSLGNVTRVGLVSGTDWILMTYYDGNKYDNECNNSSRAAHIMFVCDPEVEKSDLRFLGEQNSGDKNHCIYRYLFEISSRYACNSSQREDTISGGGIFCILFFTTAGLYVLGGFLYQRLIVGAKGLEQIPNYSFWRDFGNLQADGCNFLCRCGPRHESQAYRGIDDRLPKETERDDQLLSM